MEKTFERELPKGYKLAKVVDMKNNTKEMGKLIFYSAVLFLVPFIVTFIPLLIFKMDFLDETLGLGLLFWVPVILGYLVYIVLHELVHGWVYKRETGEKLTFGITPACAFCGVPHIFTYRKTALKAVSAPYKLFSLIFIVLIVITFFFLPGLCFGLSIVFAMHISGCAGDLYVMRLFKKKYTDDTTLMNDTGPIMSIFVYDESATDEDEKTAIQHLENVWRKPTREEKQTKIEKESKDVSLAIILISSLGALAFGFILSLYFTKDVKFRIEEPSVFSSPALWLTLISVGIIVFCSLTIKKFYKIKTAIGVAYIVLGIPLLMLSILSLSSYDICYTNNVENYGVYNSYDEGWKPELFPEEITDGMTPIYYSYYHDMSWDGIVEIYLEVEMTDSAYNELRSQYKGQLTECWYAEGYSEYARNDILDADEKYCDYAYVKKIIFNDSDKTVIFEYLNASDPVYFENIYYLERFNIDGKEYSDYLEAQNESN